MRWFRAWFRRTSLERDLARELDTHLDIHVHHLIASGVSPAEARRRARMELGGIDQVTEQVRDARAGAAIDQLLCDGRDAIRGLKRTPGITLTAVALIGLVIGGNTTIYSMVHAVITKPAAGVRGDGLVMLVRRVDGRRAGPAGPEHSLPDYAEYVAQSKTLVPLLASQFQRFVLNADNGTYSVAGALVTSNYFETLGVRLVRGRSFTLEDQTSPALVAVIGGRLWQSQFAGAEDIIGRSITLNGREATIVGVAPAPFHGAWVGENGDVWVPLVAYHRLRGTERTLADRSASMVQVIGRLAPGASLPRARAEFATLSSRLQATYPQTHRGQAVALLPYSMTSGGDSLIAEQAPRFLAIFSVVTALTLAIVCANVANLMLGRALVRQRELALRQTLGASRARVLRVLLVEGLVIAVAAWVAACVFALAVSNGVVHLVSVDNEGLTVDLAPDWQVIGYAFALAIVGTVAFTIAPAVRAWKLELLPSLRSGELGIAAGRSTLSTALVTLQLSFAVLLLTTAGLAYRSVSMLASMDAGFPKENLLLVSIETSEAAATKAARLELLDRVRERLRAVPGVQSVSYTADSRPEPVQADGSSQPVIATGMLVGPDYFSTLGMTLVAGHEFTSGAPADVAGGVLVTQHLADQLWPGQSAIGRTLRFGSRPDPVQVVGVTPNGVFSRFQRESAASYVFRSVDQELRKPERVSRAGTPVGISSGFFTVHVRHSAPLKNVGPAIRQTVQAAHNRVPIVRMRTMESDLNDFVDGVRIITVWITLFAVGSLVIAGIGQYAVIAFDMRRRTRDFGVRIALGASSQQILGSVIGQGLRWTGAGLAIGFVLSLAAGMAFRSLLVGVTPTDAPTYLGVFTLLAVASLLACYLPARRAARIDPIQALRQE
jgi:predicted permease